MRFESTNIIIVPAPGLTAIMQKADIPHVSALFNVNYVIEAALTGAINFIHYDIDPWQYFELLLKVGDDNSEVHREIVNEVAGLADDIMEYLTVFENHVVEFIATSENVTFNLHGNTVRHLTHGFFKLKIETIMPEREDDTAT